MELGMEFKWNHEFSSMLANILPAEPPPIHKVQMITH